MKHLHDPEDSSHRGTPIRGLLIGVPAGLLLWIALGLAALALWRACSSPEPERIRPEDAHRINLRQG